MQSLDYRVDIALVIDATGSMGPVINAVKESALRLYQDLTEELTRSNKMVDHLRIRVIEYRDFYADGHKAIRSSGFFELPSQSGELKAFVDGIVADGGGDEPENGLEAVALAIRSDWCKEGSKRRHVIVVWSDASVHPLDMNSSVSHADIQDALPRSFDELTDMWDGQTGMNMSAKRILLFTPDSTGWSDIANHWENSIHYPSRAGEGLKEIDYKSILDLIAKSV